jgi:RHS repeat-associated protein
MLRHYIIFSLLFVLSVSGLKAQNIPKANYIGPHGAQVNTYNGNLYLERTDLIIPNQDLPIGLSFSFNSFRDSTDVGFGYGWTHSYSLRCLPFDEGVVIERAHGRRDSFYIENEQLIPPAGIFDQLLETGAGIYELQDKYGTIFRFENPEHHYLTSIENTNGNQLQLSYTDSLLTTVSDASGRSIFLEYTEGHLSSISDQNFTGGRSWDFQYTSGRQLECVANPFGDCVSYEYDETGRMTAFYDEKGNQLSIRYDEANRVSMLQTCILTATFAYNEAQFRTTVTEQNEGTNQITTYAYNDEGKLINKTGNCCGYNMTYSYDSDNNLNEVIDANGNSRGSTFDAMGNAVATRDALSQQQQMEYGDFNRLTGFTDKRNNSTVFEYDDNGNITHIHQPMGVETTFSYDEEGNVETMTDGNGNTTEMDYNANNDLIEVRYEIGSEQFNYDNAGNLLSTTDANGNSTTMEYDALNRLKSVRDHLNNTIQYDYDAASNLILEIDPENNQKRYDYDAHNRLVQVETPIGITKYGYDALDNLTSITNAEEHTSHFTYDTRSRLTSEQDPMGFTTHYEYDNNGNVIQRVDANLQVTTYEYDALNRLTRRTYAGNTDFFEYDANGNLTKASNNDISYTFTYDALNRLTSKTADNWGLTISYEYDNAGNRTKMTDPDGGETTYVYDGNNRLVQLTNPLGETTTFTYDLAGRLTEQRNHNGTYTTYVYDAGNRLTSLVNQKANGEVLTSYDYSYNNNGLRIGMEDHTGGTASYIYDGENRLTQVVYTDGVTDQYTFDKAGSRLSLNRDGDITEYTYDAADRIQSAGTMTFDFDGNGNMIRKTDLEGTTKFEYDGENRLTRCIQTDGQVINYRYDPFGNRINRQVDEDVTRYFLDGDNVLLELDEANNTAVRYTSGLMMDNWISMQREGASYTYHTDALGSIVGLSNNTQELVNTYTYDAYGNIRSISEDVENNYRFTGREWDKTLRIYYYRTRYYSSNAGRFITKDEILSVIGRPSSLNLYTYTENSPINFADPSGEFIFNISFGLIIDLISQTTSNINKHGDNFACYSYKFSWLDILGGGKKIFDGIKIKHIKKSIKAFEEQVFKMHQYFEPGLGLHIRRFARKIGSLVEEVERIEKSAKMIDDASNLIELLGEKLGINLTAIELTIDEEACENDKSGGSKGDQDADSNLPEDDNDPPPGEIPDYPGDITIPIIRSFDPNEIVGPEGVGQDRWVKQESTLPYTILFENDPDFATAAAQRVVITHPFDDSVNPVSFRLGDFGFGSYYFEVPENSSYYSTRIDLTDSLNIMLDVIASINQQTNEAFWIFESVDPESGLPETLLAELGFLPVNDSLTRAGEGFVNFTIRPSLSAQTGDIIEAQASIVFDDNPPIITNVELNTIDGDTPVSQVSDPIDTLGNGEYRLFWEGADIGSGLSDFTLFASTNFGPFLPVAGPFSEQNDYVFSGAPDSTYRFFTLSRDSVGNVEPMKNYGEPNCMEVVVDTIANTGQGQQLGFIILQVTGNTGPLNYSWSHDTELNAPEAYNLPTGIYQVAIRDSVGCEVILDLEVELINNTVEESSPFIYQLFPVPASQTINVRFTINEPVALLSILNAQGQVLSRQQVNTKPRQVRDTRIPVGHLPPGTYFLRIESSNQSITGTFSKF